MIEFEWDPAKAKSNERKHGIRFEDAIRVFDDPNAFFREDHSTDDDRRWQAIGVASNAVLILVVHTVRASSDEELQIIRIISARLATKREQILYGENGAKNFGGY
jgi:uncharacterized DUF497 family protein